MYVVAVPSYNRQNEISKKTLQTLLNGGVDKKNIYIFVANKAQEKLYIDAVPKSLYHKKSARSFNDLIKDFIKSGYECNVSRVFLKDSKMNLMHTTGSLPMYYMTLEKSYKVEIEMIDELVKIKSSFVKLTNDLFNLPDIYQVEHSFDMTVSMKGSIDIKFSLQIYEK